MKVHFIAIGGSAMHNLAIALKLKGYDVSGSDDQIFDPSLSRLKKYGILPKEMGWDEDRITESLDAIILGMHARKDNPELLKAEKLGLKIYSYPEYIFEQTKDKKRIVIGGSHGKTTITSMILHVLNDQKINVDFMVGAQLEGFECMVKLSNEAEYVILEGDEYLSSPIDLRPKFHLYRPHVALLSGVAWDHINVFPTFDNYVEQFDIFIKSIEENGSLIWYMYDPELIKLASSMRKDVKSYPYEMHAHVVKNNKTHLKSGQEEYELEIFGQHNLENLEGARLVCGEIGVSDEEFYRSISSFSGASKRMETLEETTDFKIIKDFAHSPSKLKATTSAVKKQFPERKLLACMELHTFSSLNKEFLEHYKNSMSMADEAIVFYSDEAIKHKKLDPLNENEVKRAFGSENVKIVKETSALSKILENQDYSNSVLLLMSSGNFGGINLNDLANSLMKKHLN